VEDSLTKKLIGNIDDPVRGYNPQKASEFTVRSNSGWRGFMKFRRGSSASVTPAAENAEDVRNRQILAACAEDVVALWTDPEVQRELKVLNVSLQDQSGLYVIFRFPPQSLMLKAFSFLSDTVRITQFNYLPTPDDIVRARMHTIGPEEHRIPIETGGPESGKTWYYQFLTVQ
jgi:guanine nucleotide-binding protein subunit alpha